MERTQQPESSNYRAGLLIQQIREAKGLTQRALYLRWRDVLIAMGYVRKWPDDGEKWIGRLERGEHSKVLTNLELKALCDVLTCSVEQQVQLFEIVGLDPIIPNDQVSRQLATYVRKRSYEVYREMLAMMIQAYSNRNTGLELDDDDLKQMYNEAEDLIRRRRQ